MEGQTRATYMIRDEDGQGTNVCKDAHAVDRADDSIDLKKVAATLAKKRKLVRGESYRLSFEGTPYNGTVAYGIFRLPRTRCNNALRDVQNVNNADDIVLPIASTFYIFEQLFGQHLVDPTSEE